MARRWKPFRTLHSCNRSWKDFLWSMDTYQNIKSLLYMARSQRSNECKECYVLKKMKGNLLPWAQSRPLQRQKSSSVQMFQIECEWQGTFVNTDSQKTNKNGFVWFYWLITYLQDVINTSDYSFGERCVSVNCKCVPIVLEIF